MRRAAYSLLTMDKAFVELFNDRKIETVLDLGTGRGAYASYAAKHGAFVHAVDKLSEPESFKDFFNIKYVQLRIENVNFLPNLFDLIILRCVIQFLPNDFVTNTFGKKISDILKPNGIFYLVTFNKDDKIMYQNPERSTYYSMDDLKRIFIPLTFDFIETKKVSDNHAPYGPHEHSIVTIIARKPEAKNRLIVRR